MSCDMLYSAIYSISFFLSQPLLARLLLGPLSPPKASFIRQGGCLPFCAVSSSSFPRLHPSEAA